MLFLSSSLVIGGAVGDIFGQKTVFIVGLAIFIISSAIASFSNVLWLLLCARSAQGIGAGIAIVNAMAMSTELSQSNKVGSGIGLLASMSAVGTALGPTLGGFVTDHLSWQFVFITNVPVGGIILWLALRYLPSSCINESQRHRFDYAGAACLFVTVLSYALFIKSIAHGINLPSISLLLVTIIAAVIFKATQTRVDIPLIELGTLRDGSFVFSLLNTFIVSAVVMTSLVIGPFYLIHALQLNFSSAGTVMTASPVIVSIISIFIGQLMGRFSPKVFIVAGLIFLLLGTCLMSVLQVSSGVMHYLFNAAVLATGYACFLTSNNTYLMLFAKHRDKGKISGLVNLSRNLGLLTGATLMTVIFNFGLNGTAIMEASPGLIQAAFNTSYQIATVLILLALIILSLKPKLSSVET